VDVNDLPLLPSPFVLVIRVHRSTHQRFQTPRTPPVKTRACLPPIALDSQMGPALQLFSLSLPAAPCPPRIYPVSPSCWRRWVSDFSRAPDSHVENVICHLQPSFPSASQISLRLCLSAAPASIPGRRDRMIAAFLLGDLR